VKFFFVSREAVLQHDDELQARYLNTKTVTGTRSHHCYIPTAEKTLQVMRISGDDSSFTSQVLKTQTSAPAMDSRILDLNQCGPGQYLACMYDGKWWLGSVMETSDDDGDILVKIMHPHGPAKSFYWPAGEDLCWVPLQEVLDIIDPPTTRNGRRYYLSKNDKEKLDHHT
jgi:hypothetical protein